MRYKAGFLGAGNMGYALAKAAAKTCGGENIILSCKDILHAKEAAKGLGAAFGTAEDAAKDADFVFLGVKPKNLCDISGQTAGVINEKNSKAVIISMLAGVSIDSVKEYFGTDKKIIRIMPNTPVAVGSGLILMCSSENVTSEDKENFKDLMRQAGTVNEIDENLIDAASAVSGCGPAFLYMFSEALSDGGLLCGLPKSKALFYALNMIKGSCDLALLTGKHPAVLKDEVTSPGGSTAEGLLSLELSGFKGAVIEAVRKSYEKTKALGKK